MKKLKIYLDTSVISHLDQQDAPEKMEDTLKLWEELEQGKYVACISDVCFDELKGCNEEKQTILYGYLGNINYQRYQVTPEIKELAEKIIEFGVLTKKSYDDCLHIATAVVNNCNIIASWNFSHIVKVKTINGVRTVNLMNGYNTIDIYSPTMLLEGDDN